jgi:hypothetical protein
MHDFSLGHDFQKLLQAPHLQAIRPFKSIVVPPAHPEVHVRMNGLKTLGTKPVLEVLGLRLHLPKESAWRTKFARDDER